MAGLVAGAAILLVIAIEGLVPCLLKTETHGKDAGAEMQQMPASEGGCKSTAAWQDLSMIEVKDG